MRPLRYSINITLDPPAQKLPRGKAGARLEVLPIADFGKVVEHCARDSAG